jgi:hypothetical protein
MTDLDAGGYETDGADAGGGGFTRLGSGDDATGGGAARGGGMTGGVTTD